MSLPYSVLKLLGAKADSHMKAAAATIGLNEQNEKLVKQLEEVIAEPTLSRADKSQVMMAYIVAQLQEAEASTPVGERAHSYKKLFIYTLLLAQHLTCRATDFEHEGPDAEELYSRVDHLSRAAAGNAWRDGLPPTLPDAPPFETAD